jgi:hypothetical protein
MNGHALYMAESFLSDKIPIAYTIGQLSLKLDYSPLHLLPLAPQRVPMMIH